MKRAITAITAAALGAALPILATAPASARAGNVIVGANVSDEGGLTQTGQDEEIERLVRNGVKTIRTGLSTKSIYFIIEASKHGIGAVVILYPTEGSSAKPKRRWSDAPLSGADPHGFSGWLKPLLGQLEASGVHLTALELGNEINTSGYNGDIAIPGSGRVLAKADLDNLNDAEAAPIAKGLRNYLKVMAALKYVRNHSKLNTTTPILLAGIADWGLPSAKAWNGQLGISLLDTIAFLRANGLDKLADGYSVHVYPSGDPLQSVSARLAVLERKKIFSACRPDKPCWLTEWGIGNSSRTCPLDDSKRTQAVAAERGALSTYAAQGRLAAAIWFTWAGLSGSDDPTAIYRCGALTPAGELALAPMD